MTQTPTLYQFDITLNHVDRGLSETLALRTPRHPSETMLRLWLRVLAFAWQHQEGIVFGPGLSDPDAPDVLANDLTGVTRLWMRVGKADPVKIQRTADQHSRAHVAVLFESPARLQTFRDEAQQAKCQRLGKVELAAVDPALLEALAADESRRCKASLTIVGDHVYVERNNAHLDGPLTR